MTDKLIPTDAMIEAGRAEAERFFGPSGDEPELEAEALTAIYTAMNAARPPLSDDKLSGLAERLDLLGEKLVEGNFYEDYDKATRLCAVPREAKAKLEALQQQLRVMREAVEAMPDYIETFRLMRATGKTNRAAQASAIANRIEEIRRKALSTPEGSDR